MEDEKPDITIDTLIEYTKVQLGPIFKTDDEQVLKNIVDMVYDEVIYTSNRQFDKNIDLKDFKSLIVQCSVIAYQNRGIEGQTQQDELGQENHFIDWHQYLQDEIVSHGKRYVI